MSEKEPTVKMEGTVEELLPNRTFRITLENGRKILGYLCGKMAQKNIKVSIGDTVTVEMSMYDLDKGRITYRQR